MKNQNKKEMIKKQAILEDTLHHLTALKALIDALNLQADLLDALDPEQKDETLTFAIHSIENAFDTANELTLHKDAKTLTGELDDAIKAIDAKLTIERIKGAA